MDWGCSFLSCVLEQVEVLPGCYCSLQERAGEMLEIGLILKKRCLKNPILIKKMPKNAQWETLQRFAPVIKKYYTKY